MDHTTTRLKLGVAIVTYRPGPVVLECLDSLIASNYAPLKIVICDNQSSDDTIKIIQGWVIEKNLNPIPDPNGGEAGFSGDFGTITIIRSERNLGFAGGVNVCLNHLASDDTVDCFWLLNPDCTVPPETPHILAETLRSDDSIGMLGGRILYKHSPDIIQSDGGRVNLWTGVCKSINYGKDQAGVSPPSSEDIDFIVGASIIVSRDFLDAVGFMQEDYFLFYEEVDWALKRKAFPLVICHEAVIFHEGGTATQSASIKRRASPVTNYFQYRNRLRFVARFRPVALPIAYGVSMLKIVRLAMIGGRRDELLSAFLGLHQFGPPKAVSSKLGPTATFAAGSKP